ncbi:MAG: transcriptional regulator [Chitinophagaceae bacterium]|nr:transcriptional regulator [Chitinophagaceae bacterium]
MKKNSILIIDDHEEICRHAKSLLQLEHYEVSLAHSGNEALKILSEESFDLILCALVLPDMDGYEILEKKQKSANQSIPFVFMATTYDNHSFREAMNRGADDYLLKPFTGEDLLNVVDIRIHKQLSFKDCSAKEDEVVSYIEHVFQHIKEDHPLLQNRNVRNLKNKEVLLLEGDQSLNIYYVVSGRVKTYKSDDEGKQYLTDICLQGDFVGCAAVLTNHSVLESIIATEESQVIMIPKQDFINFLYADSNTFMKFAQELCIKVHDTEKKLIDMAYSSARKRISEALLFVLGKYHSQDVSNNDIPFQRNTLSSLAAVSNECVSRNLTDFKNEGLIRIIKNKIFILDYNKLKNIRN